MCSSDLLLENTAGQGTALGWRFEHLAAILDGVRESERLGVCIDTCHLLAAGYPATTVIVMRHAGSSVDALRSTIGAAAQLTVSDNRHGTPQLRRWAAPPGDVAAPPIASHEGAATSLWLEAAE